jgi:uncharacterized iron-regulated protein
VIQTSVTARKLALVTLGLFLSVAPVVAQNANPRPNLADCPSVGRVHGPLLMDPWPWQTVGHPLIGSSAIIAPTEGGGGRCQLADWGYAQMFLRRHAFGTDVLLFGEVHDNRWHHAVRAYAMGQFEKPTTLIFEHFRADQAAALAPFNTGDLLSPTRGSAADLFKALDWDNSGWPDKVMFEPLFEAALRSGAKIAHGDPLRSVVRDVAKRGLAALPAEEVARLKLDQPFPPAMQDALLTELEASHCGLMPKTAFTNMAIAQRYRDAYLAAQVLAAHETGQRETGRRVILFAGNGHVRDSGVPYALSLMKPDVKPAAIQFLEVEDGKNDPRDYLETGIAFFTPRAARKDPCEDMRAQFRKKIP